MFDFILAIADERKRNLLGELYNLYSQRMYMAAKKILKNDEDANDAVQDAFLKLSATDTWEVRDVRSKSTVGLVSIVYRNSAINIYKKNHQRKTIFSSLEKMQEEGFEPYSDCDETLDAMITKDNIELMTKLVMRLDLKYRDIVMLRYNYNMPYANISSILNVDPELIKGRMNRAKKKLKKMLLAEKEMEDLM